MNFFLGTHQPAWLATAGVPLFVSRVRLAGRRTFPRAIAPWALDSGGFTELSLHGAWRITAAQYVAEVRRFRDEIGRLEWAAPQDWMCEPHVLAKTGCTVQEHQRRTVDSFGELRALAPDLPWIPVVQGWNSWGYLRCVEMYDRAGINLRKVPLVGVGTVCRRQGTAIAHGIVSLLHNEGLALHAFGFKLTGLRACAHLLASADSMSWSAAARREPPLPECRGGGHINCANCLRYAREWRSQLLDSIPPPAWAA